MMSLPREQAMMQFFEFLSDIVLRPGDFDFEAASERMQCEGGEIYYLVAGHLGLMSMPDPLLSALGLPDSMGETKGGSLESLEGTQRAALEKLADPMRMMKLFAVAYQTGSSEEVVKYLHAFESLLANVSGSVEALVSIHQELDAALDVAGHVVPIPSLASGSAAAAKVDIPESVSLPVTQPVTTPVPDAVESVAPAVPLPPAPEVVVDQPKPILEETVPVAVPLPVSAVALPVVVPVEEESKSVNFENEREVARATQDAFSGAFSSQFMPEPAPERIEEVHLEEVPVPIEEVEEFVSAAEHFIAADTDGSGALDVEELAQATGTSIEEAAALHAQADTDGDGVVSLSEFIASPAAEKTATLPKPVAPVRKPLLNPAAQQANQPPSPVQQRPQPLPQQPWQQPQQPQQQWPQPQPQGWQQPMQPQGWPQPQAPLVQPTIRSGVHCRGCGIGLDPYWRFCPVCGQQNLGY